MTSADVLVIGGGPAGAAAAARLAARGRRVSLYERQPESRHQVCGEFLSAAATAELAALGVEPAGLGARPISRMRVCGQNSEATTALPFTGYGLSRARLDRSLLAIAARRGAHIRMGLAVRTLARKQGTWSAALSDGSRIESGSVILATGKHDLRGHARTVSTTSPMVGFKMHCRLRPDETAALGDTVELFVYEGGYAGLQLIEDGIVNFCLVVDADRVRGGGHAWQNALSHLRRVAPPLADRLRDAWALWDRPASVARIPFGYVCTSDSCVERLYRVGDQAAVIASLAGEGIAIALRSARLAADAVLAGRPAASHIAALRHEVLGPVRRAGLIDFALHHRPLRRLGVGLASVPGVVSILARSTRLPMKA